MLLVAIFNTRLQCLYCPGINNAIQFFFWENNRFFLSFFGMSESFDFVCVRCINAKWTRVVTIHMHSNSSGCDNFHWLTTLLMPSGYLIFCLFLQTFRKQDQVLDKFPLFLDVKILNL